MLGGGLGFRRTPNPLDMLLSPKRKQNILVVQAAEVARVKKFKAPVCSSG